MGFDNENVLFGAEFDPSSFKKGTDALITSLTSVDSQLKKVQTTLAETTGKLEGVQSELAGASKEFEGLDKSAKDYQTTADTLKGKIDGLTKQNDALTGAYKKQTEELTALAAKNEVVKKSMEDVESRTKKMQDLFQKKITANVDIGQLNNANTKLAELKTKFSQIFTPGLLNEMFDTKQIDLMLSHVAEGKGEFEQFTRVVDALGAALLTVEPGTKEFEELSTAIRAGKQVIAEYSNLYEQATKVVADSEPKYKSIRVRLQELRNELTKLEEAGQEESDQYKETQLAAARLTDQYGDMQQQLRILASDTRNIDFGLSALNALGVGFQTVTGGLELFGISNETAEEAQKKLLAIMSLVQGAQQLQNLLLKEGVIRTVGANLATQAYAATQRLLAVSLGVSTVASRTLATALITTGVGALVVGLGFLIAKLVEWTSTSKDAEKAQESLNAEIEHQSKLLSQDIDNIDYFTKVRNERLKARGASEATIYQSNQQSLREKIEAYNGQIAALNDQYGKVEVKQRDSILKEIYKLEDERQKIARDLDLNGEEERARVAEEGRKKAKEISNKRAQDEKQARDLLEQIRKDLALMGLNEEQKELLTLKFEHDKQLQVLRAAGASTVELEELYQGKRQEVRAKYRTLRSEEEKRILAELEKLQIDASERRLNNIQEYNARETERLNVELAKQRKDLQENQTGLLDAVLNDKNKGLISPAKYAETVKEINLVFDKLFQELDEKTANDFKALGGAILQRTVEGINQALNIGTNNISIQAKREIAVQAKLYLEGQINYEQYQKNVTKITEEETSRRLELTKKALREEIQLLQQRLKGNILPDERKALETQISDLEKQYGEANQTQVDGEVAAHKRSKDENAAYLANVLQAYVNFSNSVVSVLDAISQAEEKRLDRSISFQEKRVAEAKEMALKGNAEQLEIEQKRLDQLQAKREANARRQLVIDNAVRLSQTTLAAITAIAQASATGNPFLAVAAGAAVLAAIASVFSFAASMQQPVAEFFEGTTFVQGKEGRDKIPAKVTKGEAIIPVDRNREYHDTVKAIYNKTVPAEVLNLLVNSYPNIDVPATDFSRLTLATDRYFESKEQVETNQKLEKINGTLYQLYEKLDNLDNVSLRLDENGFAISVIRAFKSEKLKWFN